MDWPGERAPTAEIVQAGLGDLEVVGMLVAEVGGFHWARSQSPTSKTQHQTKTIVDFALFRGRNLTDPLGQIILVHRK